MEANLFGPSVFQIRVQEGCKGCVCIESPTGECVECAPKLIRPCVCRPVEGIGVFLEMAFVPLFKSIIEEESMTRATYPRCTRRSQQLDVRISVHVFTFTNRIE